MKLSRVTGVLVLALLSVSASPVLAQGRKRSAGKGGRDRPAEGNLKEGQKAPDLKLARLDDDGKPGKKVRLSAFKGKRPVVLVFGSYT